MDNPILHAFKNFINLSYLIRHCFSPLQSWLFLIQSHPETFTMREVFSAWRTSVFSTFLFNEQSSRGISIQNIAKETSLAQCYGCWNWIRLRYSTGVVSELLHYPLDPQLSLLRDVRFTLVAAEPLARFTSVNSKSAPQWNVGQDCEIGLWY